MSTTLQRPTEEVRKERDDFREFLDAHGELDTLTRQVSGEEGPGGPSRGRWLAAAFAVIALVVAAIVVAVMVDFGGTETSMTRAGETEDEALARLVEQGYIPAQALSPQTYWTGNDFAPRTTPQAVVYEDEVLAQLVRQGMVPAAALTSMTYWTGHDFAPTAPPQAFVTEDQVLAQLVARGYVPAAALTPTTYWTGNDFAPTAPSGTAELLATMELVNRGLVPAGTLEVAREAQATIDLVNRGLIPAETLVARTATADVSGSDVHLQNLADELG